MGKHHQLLENWQSHNCSATLAPVDVLVDVVPAPTRFDQILKQAGVQSKAKRQVKPHVCVQSSESRLWSRGV